MNQTNTISTGAKPEQDASIVVSTPCIAIISAAGKSRKRLLL